MKRSIIIAAAIATLAAGAVHAQSRAMTVQEFLTTANGIPRNPTALLRSDTRRLINEFKGGMTSVRREQAAARAAGRQPASCAPQEVKLSPSDILGRFQSIPTARRNITVGQAVRDWMAERYPCPA